MTTGDLIQFGALFVAIASLAIQQTRLLYERQRQELRIETKLRLLYVMQNQYPKYLKEDALITEYSKQQPIKKVSHAEVRKALYEMLADGTTYYQQDGSYRARWRHVK